MMRRASLALMVVTALLPTRAAGQVEDVHGESAVFVHPGVVIVWAVLHAPVEDETQVVIHVASIDATYRYVRVDGVDPFTQARRGMGVGGAIDGSLDIRTPRTTFADFPRREIRLYRTIKQWRHDTPALIVYYHGVPDTTPEFVSEATMLSYLTRTAGR
jgi:hypothetical protein